MAHTYGSCLYHFVFSTRNRQMTIGVEWRGRLWNYRGGIARENEMRSLCVGGTGNHCHILLLIPPSMAPAKEVQLVKAGSSKWINEEFNRKSEFAWQEGYGVFTIGFSQIGVTKAYIGKQEDHHRIKTFEEEYQAFLRKHMIEFKEDYVFG
ncbi:MAG: IS200/IS605 family transposase [bacterium]|nr:IS200/IS605 family transposase [bacterium]